VAAIHEKAALPLLELPTARDDLIQPAAVAERLRSSDQVLLLGTGGSSLGGQTLAALAESPFGPPARAAKLHFLDNIDPLTFEALLRTSISRAPGSWWSRNPVAPPRR
jgi:glucose-6-phosphate isomerase